MNLIWNPPLILSINNIDHEMRDANFCYGNCNIWVAEGIVPAFHKACGSGNAQNPRGIMVRMTNSLPVATIRGC
jgi:hypothetical protein